MSALPRPQLDWIARLPGDPAGEPLTRLARVEADLLAEDRALTDRRRELRKTLSDVRQYAETLAARDWSAEEIRAAKVSS